MNAETQSGAQERAAEWYARLHAPDATPAERAAFEAWLAENAAHARAYAAVEQLAGFLAARAASSDRLKAMVDEALAACADRSPLAARPEPRKAVPVKWPRRAGERVSSAAQIDFLVPIRVD